MQGNLYLLKPENSVQNVYTNKPPHNDCIHLLHHQLGHPGFEALQKTVQLTKGIKLKQCSFYLDSEVCKTIKSKAAPVRTPGNYQSNDLMDLLGPFPISLGGARFALSIEDHFSRYGFCYLLKTKANAN